MNFDNILSALNACESILAVALGGSRSRNLHTQKSDYDLFCIIKESEFDEFRNSFRDFLEAIESVEGVAQVFYLEDWGYLFKAIDNLGIIYDISIIPQNRISEMSIRSTNIVLKDTDNLYQKQVDNAEDSKYMIDKLESDRYVDYYTLFAFETRRFQESVIEKDYWYTIRCLERMKNYYIRCDRIIKSNFSKSRSCPERQYIDEGNRLKDIYILDGSLETLEKTGRELINLFLMSISDSEVMERCQKIWRTEED